jgi:2',3'-cyclic-nucleotide 2'-phosphodiesterase (5'-nucleotidase family)
VLNLVLLALALATAPSGSERVRVTVLATTDIHGHVLPYDYFERKPWAGGLAGAATLIAGVRSETKNTLVVDCGDTIQGSPLASVYEAERRAGETRAPEPTILAMNAVGYDAMVVGNHEYNFGLEALAAARAASRFPWLSANTETGAALSPFAPYLLKTVGGVKVAVIGITTPAIPQWEKPENIRGMSWLDPKAAVRRALAALAPEHPDVILAAVHGGLGREAQTGAASPNELPGENPVYELAEAFPELSAILYGHSHRREPGRRIGKVLVVQPRNWAMEVARLDLELEPAPGGGFTLVSTESRLLPVTLDTPPDPRLVALVLPYQQAAERYLDTPVTRSQVALSGARGRFEDTALVDMIHTVQLYYAHAQVSFTSLFQTRVEVPRGPVTRRELAALYIYDNELYAIEGDGGMVKAALENASRYYLGCPEPSCSHGPLVDHSIPGFNFDTAAGVDYAIDLRRPVGERIVGLRYHGAPLRDDQPLRIALNNYRAAGSAGYGMFKDAKIVWRSNREIRDLLADYWSERRELPERPDENWRLLPPAVVETLVREESQPR